MESRFIFPERLARFVLGLVAALALAGCAAPRLILSDHPLAGRIWAPSEHRFISAAEAERRLADADIALLGEIHDNPSHHQIQAQVLQRLVALGKRPALALEQIDTEWQPAVDAALRSKGVTPAAIHEAGRMAGGWEWPLYRPLISQALKEKLPIVAANLSRPRARVIASSGVAALGPGEAERLALDQTWTAEQNTTMRGLLVDGHCGDDSPMIDRLIHVQRSRDAVMADRILAGDKGSVAILGRSHARRDIGVPLYLEQREPDKRVLSLGLMEVAADYNEPGDYPDAAPGRHDLVWFTPATRRNSACENLKRGQGK